MKNILTKAYTRAAIPRYATFLCFFALSAHATSITLPYSFTAGSPISASQMMGNFSSITSALSSTTSSPWVPSSSNIYFNTGSVGIGSSTPTHTLEVSGSVAVNGALTSNSISTLSYVVNVNGTGNTQVIANSAANVIYSSYGTSVWLVSAICTNTYINAYPTTSAGILSVMVGEPSYLHLLPIGSSQGTMSLIVAGYGLFINTTNTNANGTYTLVST